MRALIPHEQLLTRSDQRILDATGPRDDILIPDRPSLVRIDGASATDAPATGVPVVDPLSKAASLVESGELVVDGTLIDAPSPSYLEAIAAWRLPRSRRSGRRSPPRKTSPPTP